MAGLRIGGFPTRLPRLTLTGDLTVTKQSTTALTVARTGTTYAFQVDTNTANSATGLKVTAAAAAGGVALAAISSGTDEAISLASKGAAALTLLTNSLTRVTVASTGAVTIAAPTSGVGLTVSGGGAAITGASTITTAATAGGATTLTLTTGAHTAVTTEQRIINASGPTFTITGNIASQRYYRFQMPLVGAATTQTITTGVTFSIEAAPSIQDSAVITNPIAFQVGGNVTIAGASGTSYRTIDIPAHTVTDATTTQITSSPAVAGMSIGQITIAQSAGAVTVDNAASLYIAAAPTPGASVTLTNTFALWVDAGMTRLDGLTWIGPTGRAVDSTFANADMTTGITISQGAADNQVLAFKSSDVAHGMTSIAETDSYGYFGKQAATTGGCKTVGLSAGTTGLSMFGIHVTDNTTKSTAGVGAIVFDARVKTGTTSTSCAADANLISIATNGTTRFIFDAEGTLHSTHASGVDYFGGAAGAYLAAGTVKGVGLALPHVVNKAASANVRNSHNAETSSTALTYTKVKTITITNGLLGAQRFLFDLKTAGGAATAYGRIYRNGSAIGTEQTDVTGGYVTKSEDLTQTWNPGDTAELYVKTSDGAQAAYVQNFRIAYDDSATVAVTSANS